mmetsp:Transcript_3410/g.5024  ORF Transcript_3410/g.5024 Transcript_3410/m.5024 type:complete len:212 (-) Transcript_3410:22-657(-)
MVWSFNLHHNKTLSTSDYPVGMIIDRENTSQLKFEEVKKKEVSSTQKQSNSPKAKLDQFVSAQKDINLLRQKHAWEFSYSPLRSLIMTAIIFYMQGNSIHIIMLFILFSNLYTPIRSILNVNNEFKRFEFKEIVIPKELSKISSKELNTIKDSVQPMSLFLQKLIYIFCTSLQIVLCLYKMHTIGLLPTVDDFIPVSTPIMKELTSLKTSQ